MVDVDLEVSDQIKRSRFALEMAQCCRGFEYVSSETQIYTLDMLADKLEVPILLYIHDNI